MSSNFPSRHTRVIPAAEVLVTLSALLLATAVAAHAGADLRDAVLDRSPIASQTPPQVVASIQPPSTGPFEYLLPVVSKTSGAGGSEWRTDIHLSNPFQQTAVIEVRAFPAWADVLPEDAVNGQYTLTSYASRIIEDLHGDLGLEDGNYAVSLSCDLPVAIAARFYNLQQGTELSQFMNAIPAWEQLLAGDQIRFVLPKEQDVSRRVGYRANTFMRLTCNERGLFSNLLAPKVNVAVYSRQGIRRAHGELRVGSSQSDLPNGGLAQFSRSVENHFGIEAWAGDTLVYTVTRGQGIIISTGVQNNGGLDDGWIDTGIIQRLLVGSLTVSPSQPVVGDVAILSFTGTSAAGYEITSISAGIDQLLPLTGTGSNTIGVQAYLVLSEAGSYTPAAMVSVKDPEGRSWSRTFRGEPIVVETVDPYIHPADSGNHAAASNLNDFAYYAGFGRYGNACFTEAAARETFRAYTDGVLSNGEIRGGWQVDRSGRELHLLDVDGAGTRKIISRLPWDAMRYFTTMLPPP